MFNTDNEKINGEMFLYNFLKKKCKVVFDVGVNESIYYLTEKDIDFHLFEPNPKPYSVLIEKTKDMDNVRVNNIGLGAEDKTLPLYPGCMSLIRRPLLGNENRSIDVKITTLDKYVSENSIKHIDFLKIDVEGWELDVIKGSINSLSFISHIQFEYGGCWTDANLDIKDMMDILSKEGFETFLITSTKLIYVTEMLNHGQYCNYFSTKKIDDVSPIVDLNLQLCGTTIKSF